MKRTIFSALLVIAAAAAAFAQESKPTANSPAKSVIKTLRAAGNFNTFLSLLERAGLSNLGFAPAGFVGGPGPNRPAQAAPSTSYQTVFAPNDAAFARMPPGALEALKKSPTRLRSFLLAHFVPGKVFFDPLTGYGTFTPARGGNAVSIPPNLTIPAGKELKSVQGSVLTFSYDDDTLHTPTSRAPTVRTPTINGHARVGKFRNVMVSDYSIVIHEVDAVLFLTGI